jgi:hypothetical protein
MRAFLLLICFLVGACATSAERAPARFNVDDAFVVEFESNWTDISGPSRMPHRSVHLLTIQAPALQRLYLVGDLPAGESMVAAPSRRQDAVVYRSDLSRTELVEFVSANLSALGFVRIEPRNIRSAVLGGANGVRFDARMQTTAGLDYSVMALAAQSDGRLRLILFTAPDEFYFQRLSPEIDRMLNRAASN